MEDEIGVEHADAPGVDVAARRLADEREGRPAEQARIREHRVDAVLEVRPLLAVVEHADDVGARSRAVLEHREDGRVAALHVGGAAADHARASKPGSW